MSPPPCEAPRASGQKHYTGRRCSRISHIPIGKRYAADQIPHVRRYGAHRARSCNHRDASNGSLPYVGTHVIAELRGEASSAQFGHASRTIHSEINWLSNQLRPRNSLAEFHISGRAANLVCSAPDACTALGRRESTLWAFHPISCRCPLARRLFIERLHRCALVLGHQAGFCALRG